jgi:hypothetical protein
MRVDGAAAAGVGTLDNTARRPAGASALISVLLKTTV